MRIRLARVLRLYRSPLASSKVHIGLLASILVVGALLHYGDSLPLLSAAASHTPIGLANRQSLERILLLLPVLYGSVVYGIRGGLITLAVAEAIMVPRALMGPGDLVQTLLQVAGISVIGGLFVALVVSERRRVEHAKALAQRVIVAQEEERRRIARELHDETVQSLYVITQRLDHLASWAKGGSDQGVVEEVQRVRTQAVEAATDLRRLLQDLRPRILDDVGFIPALEWLLDETLRQHGVKGQLEVRGAPALLSPDHQLLLWRIAQESLSNVGKHAQASEVALTLYQEDYRVRMAIRDNGRGFEAKRLARDPSLQAKLGIQGMQERARLLGGTLTVRSEVGKGTTVSVDVPIAVRGGTAARPWDPPKGSDERRAYGLGGD